MGGVPAARGGLLPLRRVTGPIVAGTLEYNRTWSLGFLPKLSIGLIKEDSKLILSLVFYFLGRYRSEAAGIVSGAATASRPL